MLEEAKMSPNLVIPHKDNLPTGQQEDHQIKSIQIYYDALLPRTPEGFMIIIGSTNHHGYRAKFIQYEYHQNGEKCFAEQTCIIKNAGDVVMSVGGIDMKGKPYDAVHEKILQAKSTLKLRLINIALWNDQNASCLIPCNYSNSLLSDASVAKKPNLLVELPSIKTRNKKLKPFPRNDSCNAPIPSEFKWIQECVHINVKVGKTEYPAQVLSMPYLFKNDWFVDVVWNTCPKRKNERVLCQDCTGKLYDMDARPTRERRQPDRFMVQEGTFKPHKICNENCHICHIRKSKVLNFGCGKKHAFCENHVRSHFCLELEEAVSKINLCPICCLQCKCPKCSRERAASNLNQDDHENDKERLSERERLRSNNHTRNIENSGDNISLTLSGSNIQGTHGKDGSESGSRMNGSKVENQLPHHVELFTAPFRCPLDGSNRGCTSSDNKVVLPCKHEICRPCMYKILKNHKDVIPYELPGQQNQMFSTKMCCPICRKLFSPRTVSKLLGEDKIIFIDESD